MFIEDIMIEAGITIDDIRWYLSVETAKTMLIMKDKPGDLVNWIHSKKMEADVYDMEQRFIEQLNHEWETRRCDEASIRDIFYYINREKYRRKENNTIIEKKKRQP